MPRIAANLRVSVVVEGAIARSGDRLRLTARLIDARRELHLWSESYERPLAAPRQTALARTCSKLIGAWPFATSPAGTGGESEGRRAGPR